MQATEGTLEMLTDKQQQALILALEAARPGEPVSPQEAQSAINWAMRVTASYEALQMALKGHLAIQAAEGQIVSCEPLHGARLASQVAKIREVMA